MNENETECYKQLVQKKQIKMGSFLYNLGHNILELYNVLAQIRLTTSKTKRGIQYTKLGIRVAWRVANNLRLRILGNKEILRKSQIWVET